MPNKLKLEFLNKTHQHSEYDWVNIYRNDEMIGKARCKKGIKFLTIYSINIFTEYERHGYAKEIINIWKKKFDEIIADRVRFTAKKFWLKMGFVDKGDGNYIFKK